jgi:outer membrane lipoprotein-sorting protein
MTRTNSLRFTLALTVLVATGAGAQQNAASLPAASTLVAKYDAAIGAQAMMKAPQVTTKGGMTMSAAGISATFEMVQLAPNRMQMVMTIPGVGTVQTGYDGTTAWSSDPMQGPRILTGQEAEQIVEQADPRMDSRSPEFFTSMQTVADTTMNGERCYLVKLTWKSGRETFDCYSAASGLRVGSTSVQKNQMGQIPMTMLFSDYKKFGNFMVPTKTVSAMMGQEQVVTITEVVIGTGAGVTISPPAELKALVKPPAK